MDASVTGVDFVHAIVEGHPREYLYYSGMAAGGTAIGDLNNDGRPDLFVASGPNSNRLYLQGEEPFTFRDATESAGLATQDVWSCGATLVDINADGRLDIYIANYDSPNQLFVNRGDGTFRDEAYKYELNMTDASLEGVFADFDRDGDLDMYLLTYRFENPDGMPLKAPIVTRSGKREILDEFKKYYELVDDEVGYGVIGRSDGLLENNGDGTFSIVSEEMGILGRGHGHSAMWWDFNDDGLQDLFVGNDFNDPDRLYEGGSTFREVAGEMIPHTTWFSMGCDVGDVDNDGRMDLLTTDMSSTTHFKQKTTMGSMGRNLELLTTAVPRQYMRNALLLGGPGRFREAAYLAGMASTDWTWSVQLMDLDCDGRLDAFFTNGSVRSFTDSDRVLTLSQRKGKTEWDIYKDTPPLKEKNLAFRNLGDLRFEDVSELWGVHHLGVSMSSAHGDFDGDGDLDLVVANVDEPLSIYRNDLAENRRIALELRAPGLNRFATGARVTLSSPAGIQVRELQPSRGFIASNEPVVFFGCGGETQVDIEIRWPDGTQESRWDLETGRRYTIIQSESLAKPVSNSMATAESVFVTNPGSSSSVLPDHEENDFDDFLLQSLLPHRMSRLGPCLAAADGDGDGVAEVFRGGAHGQSGALWKGTATDSASRSAALEADAAYEDMGAVWLDIDADGKLELLVASGGNDWGNGPGGYPLRLYSMSDQGELQRQPEGELIPAIDASAGGLAVADYDRDGDVDVFVCGRQTPGNYPLPGQSFLLVNEDGKLKDRTRSMAPTMSELGMVTSALWSDVDHDGDLDLLVTSEWDSVRLFRNQDGQLTDDTVASGLHRYRGWWTGISSGDFDNDGDLDYVATNLGLNTKYHASEGHPYQIFYGDFEGSGTRKLVEAEYEKETLFPVRGKSCSTHAMPFLADKFSTYRGFAEASLEDIYTPQCLDDAYRVSANWLSTSILINDGVGNFEVRPLLSDAQIAPGFGTVVADLTGNGCLDVFIAQNFHSPQPETGNMDGGLGCLLEGDGMGSFTPVNSSKAGVVIPLDAMAACLTDTGMLVSVNDGPLQTISWNANYLPSEKRQRLKVRFENAISTAELAGTRVTVTRGEGRQMLEIAAGSGYLSQQPPFLYFAGPDSELSWNILVEWPGGDQNEYEAEATMREFIVPRN